MPYFIAKDREGCKGGWAVVDEAGAILGCHQSKQSAIDQAVAVSISTDEPFEGERALLAAGDYVTWVRGGETYYGEIYRIDGDQAEVKIYEDEDGVYVESVLLAMIPLSDLTKVADLPSGEPMDDLEVSDESGAPAVIADIDGTLITFQGDRNEKVYAYLESFDDTEIVIVTARLESERDETISELNNLSIGYDQLIMKPNADLDSTEYKKIRAEQLLETYNVMVAVDDSADIRSAYSSLGITAIAPADVPDVPEDDEVAPNNRWVNVAKALIARIEPEQERETMTANTRSKWVDVAWRIKSQLEGGDSEGRSTSKQEQRIHATNFEIRETADGMSFTGYAAVFNSDSEPLPFIERIAPGAFKRSLQSRNEVKLLWNHDAGEPLASVRGGTLRLTEDEIGLRVEATLANTSRGKDVAELIRSKTIDSMSFGFSVIKDSWQGEVRTLEAVRLFETSIVSWPAYTATAGTISVRSAAPGIDADQLADALMRLESGEELEESHATLITDVVAKLTKTEEVQEVQGDILALKKKKLDLLLKEM